jgi:hypothetical protein
MAPRFLGLVDFGSLRLDGRPLPRAERPWLIDTSILRPVPGLPEGDIADFESAPDMARWTLGDTPREPGLRLRWIVIEDHGRRLLICDRVILVRVSWDDLNGAGYVAGHPATIDTRGFACRLLTGGAAFRIAEDGHAGGAPENEWDRLVAGDESVEGLPPAPPRDPRPLRLDDAEDAHNQIWHWFGAVSWTQEPYRHRATARCCRGFHAAGFFYLNTRSHRHEDIGWRPVLEEV